MGSSCMHAFAVIGIVCTAAISLAILLFVWRLVKVYVLARPLKLHADLKEMGSWAVVTALKVSCHVTKATDGIGKQYALHLAELGLNIVLVGRSPEKLKATEDEVRARGNVQVKTVVVDCSGGREIYADVERELSELEIGVLVNNVGMAYPGLYSDFLAISRDYHADMINVNNLSYVMMTHIVLPQMISRKRGTIVNISSDSARVPYPFLATYSATKAFVDFLTRSLETELQGTGVIIQGVLPGFVATKMSLEDVSFYCPSASVYVRSALTTIGVQSRTSGYLVHALQVLLMKIVPDFVVFKFIKLEMEKRMSHPKLT
ncbi:PREDICTED: inactive hydroxysteroid dehydrogenase-like protein 1 [Priapulus caudatus]|uniref:Inactive hydroxysteroid dehydrogenase-like protein 1 n=1 Tax=Priapulus caudatus TaxID=37621 RepID=A0ABM1F935_PRICU|nr:PREDICTED: inactive hydroxysteroid dehydrogenase-like protein 1 [Priapulus caudatus]